KRVVEHINECRRENWIDIHNLRIIKFGEKIHIDCHTTIPWYFNALEVHDELKKVEETISDIIPNNLEAFIHADPCLPASCKVCSINCPVRVHAFEEKIIWTMENVLKNAKHGIDK
ncbi:MAG TPA: cation transporter dimerization domain-containing protein, partial [Chitinophagales bacterium]|nr:cation transporter dimerization domain-containing protein [Chitinophagales bacterium]